MRSTHAIAVASTLAIAGGALYAGLADPGSAEAASTFRVTPEQLQINQRISQAAVRRSNEALNLLRPVRPANSTDKNPVNPFSGVPRGSGWPTAAFADNAVTTAKLANGAVTQTKLDAPTAAIVGSVRRLPLTRVPNGQTATLLTVGTLTFTARCRVNVTEDGVANRDVADILISTSQNGASFDGADAAANLLTTTPEADRQYTQLDVATTTAGFDQETDGAALDPNGVGVTGQPFAGVNLPGRPAGECTFGGYFLVT